MVWSIGPYSLVQFWFGCFFRVYFGPRSSFSRERSSAEQTWEVGRSALFALGKLQRGGPALGGWSNLGANSTHGGSLAGFLQAWWLAPFKLWQPRMFLFPCFHELAQVGLLRLERSWTAEALETSILEEAGIGSDRRWTAGHRRGPGWLGLGPWLPGCVAWRDCPDGTSTRSCWRDHCPPSHWGPMTSCFFPWKPPLPYSYWSRSSALCLLSRPLCRGCLRGWRTLCWPRWVVRVNLLCCHRTARSPWMMPQICVLPHAQFFGQRADWASEECMWSGDLLRTACRKNMLPSLQLVFRKFFFIFSRHRFPAVDGVLFTSMEDFIYCWENLVFWRDASFACCPLARILRSNASFTFVLFTLFCLLSRASAFARYKICTTAVVALPRIN